MWLYFEIIIKSSKTHSEIGIFEKFLITHLTSIYFSFFWVPYFLNSLSIHLFPKFSGLKIQFFLLNSSTIILPIVRELIHISFFSLTWKLSSRISIKLINISIRNITSFKISCNLQTIINSFWFKIGCSNILSSFSNKEISLAS